jgi:hypothetical protein
MIRIVRTPKVADEHAADVERPAGIAFNPVGIPLGQPANFGSPLTKRTDPKLVSQLQPNDARGVLGVERLPDADVKEGQRRRRALSAKLTNHRP